MTDLDIIRLLWIRDELAIEQLEDNYGRYCRQISWDIVQNREDVGECLNDTWWKTWCSIPENKPDSLRAYVARITRNLSLNKVIHNQAWKRGYGKISTIEKEVGDLIGEDVISRMIDRDDFVRRMDKFLNRQSQIDRMIFVLRFWYMKTPKKIAKQMDMKEKTVYNTLYQMRKRFRDYWEQSESQLPKRYQGKKER